MVVSGPTRSRKAYEKNPRYKYDNIISLDLDMPEGTTQNYMGPDMVSNVSQVRQTDRQHPGATQDEETCPASSSTSSSSHLIDGVLVVYMEETVCVTHPPLKSTATTLLPETCCRLTPPTGCR